LFSNFSVLFRSFSVLFSNFPAILTHLDGIIKWAPNFNICFKSRPQWLP
jgi:hypothetical protein